MHILDGMLADGINRKIVIVLLLMPFLLVGFNCVCASPSKNIVSPSHVSLTDSVLVAGDFQYLDITVPNEGKDICIIAFCGTTEPEYRSDHNFYVWEFKQDEWRDASGYDSSYIDPSKCHKENNTYSFCIRISDNVDPGCWTIKILIDGKESSSTSFNVIIGDLCLFFSTILGVYEPMMKQKELLVKKEVLCCYKDQKMEVIEKNIDRMVDRVLKNQVTEIKEEKPMYNSIDLLLTSADPLGTQESIRSVTSLYPRSKLKDGQNHHSKVLFFSKVWTGGKIFVS